MSEYNHELANTSWADKYMHIRITKGMQASFRLQQFDMNINDLPSMEEENMNYSGCQASKIKTINHSKDSAEVERTLAVISIYVNMEFWVYDS